MTIMNLRCDKTINYYYNVTFFFISSRSSCKWPACCPTGPRYCFRPVWCSLLSTIVLAFEAKSSLCFVRNMN